MNICKQVISILLVTVLIICPAESALARPQTDGILYSTDCSEGGWKSEKSAFAEPVSTPAEIRFVLPEGARAADDAPVRAGVGEEVVLPGVTGNVMINDHCYTFKGWVKEQIADTTDLGKTRVYVPGEPYTIGSTSEIFFGLYSYRASSADPKKNVFTLVEETPADWTGEYVMTGLEKGKEYAHRTDDAGLVGTGMAAVALQNTGIYKNRNTLSNVSGSYVILIQKTDNHYYTMKLLGCSSDVYLSCTGNDLSAAEKSSNAETCWKISLDRGKISIESAVRPGHCLRFHGDDINEKRFRCCRSGGEAVNLYRCAGSSVLYYATPGQDTACRHCYILKNAREASCTQNGYTGDRVCKYCGIVQSEGELIPALGHNWGKWTVIRGATCEEKGMRKRICSRCRESETEMISTLGHEWGEPEFQFSRDCKSAVAIFTCIHNRTHVRKLEASVTCKVTIPATCTEMGTTAYTATAEFEGKIYKTTKEVQNIEMLPHTGEIRDAKAPTCTEAGYSGDKVCCTCGKILEVGKVMPAAGHDWSDWEVDREATETQTGLKSRTCFRCGKAETKEIPVVDHTWSKPEFRFTEGGKKATAVFTCLEDQSLTREVEASVTCSVRVPATCTEMGTTAYTATVEFKGEVYNETVEIQDIPAMGHRWDTPKFQFSEDGKKAVAVFSCLNDGTHKEELEASVSSRIKEPAKCEQDGTTAYTALVEFEGKSYYTVLEIQDIKANGHTERIKNAEKATCTEDGFTGDKYCAVCGKLLKKGEVIPALGHEWGSWNIVKPATCQAEGLKERRCMHCGKIESRQIPRLFSDVDMKTYYAVPVQWATENEITKGTGSNMFSPNVSCSRKQIVTFLWRAAGKPEPRNTGSGFADVPEDYYYNKAVCWAVENGITSGVDIRHFGPDEACSRKQVVTFLWRAAGKPEPRNTGSGFADVPEDYYYNKAVCWAVEKSITTGVSEIKFCPDGICTRGQIVTFLYRRYGK